MPGRLGRISWNGLTFGPGTQYGVQTLTGIDDLPTVVTQDLARASQDGEYTGPDYAGARTVQIGLGLVGQDPDDLRALKIALRTATQTQAAPAALQFLDQGLLVYAKVRKRSITEDLDYLWSLGTAALEFYCADPYLYSLDEHTASTTAFSPATGRTYPRTYPLSYGAIGASGRITATNAGASTAYPVLRLDGPVANPSIEQVTTGATLTLDATLNAGEYLIIDTRTRAVLLMGTTPRRDWVRGGSDWPLLQPGSNTIAYRADALAGQSQAPTLLTVSWRDTTL